MYCWTSSTVNMILSVVLLYRATVVVIEVYTPDYKLQWSHTSPWWKQTQKSYHSSLISRGRIAAHHVTSVFVLYFGWRNVSHLEYTYMSHRYPVSRRFASPLMWCTCCRRLTSPPRWTTPRCGNSRKVCSLSWWHPQHNMAACFSKQESRTLSSMRVACAWILLYCCTISCWLVCHSQAVDVRCQGRVWISVYRVHVVTLNRPLYPDSTALYVAIPYNHILFWCFPSENMQFPCGCRLQQHNIETTLSWATSTGETKNKT